MGSTIISQRTLVALAVQALAKNSGSDSAAFSSDQQPTTDDISKTTSTHKSLQKPGATRTVRGGSLALSPNGQILAGAHSILDRTIKIWNLRTGELLRTLTGHSDSVVAVAFSLDGQTLVSGSEDTKILIWDLHTGEVLRTLTADCDCADTAGSSCNQQKLVSNC